ncbi:MAG: amidohydrolase [Lachnospiraceae bacterium]|nr:amidohydrolase [Lachnospiraceae bacterium]
MNVRELAKEQEQYVIECRHHLHAHPELGTEEVKTTEFIKAELEKAGIAVQTFDGITGCIGTIEGGKPGKTVMLRADIDALPITEEPGKSYCSVTPGVMHACGHDCHTAMLLGAAKILAAHKAELCGTVRLIFQMAEELGRKSEEYVKRGALEGVDAIFGMHVRALMDAGTVNFEAGERMACSDRFTIRVRGKLTHGSAPHLGHDAILAAAAAVQALQQIPSRVNNPFNSLVVTVGMMNGGTKENIVADDVELVGTVRAFNKELRDSMPKRIEKAVKGVVESYNCTAEFDYYFGPSPLINEDKTLVELAQGAAGKIMGESALKPLTKLTGAEDFSVFMEKVPGVYGFLGCRNREKGIDCVHHHPAFDVDEEVLYLGAGIYAQFAFDYLQAESKM